MLGINAIFVHTVILTGLNPVTSVAPPTGQRLPVKMNDILINLSFICIQCQSLKLRVCEQRVSHTDKDVKFPEAL